MSGTQIDVHVNRDPTQSLEVTETALTVHESFDLVFHGHGQPAHVHCRLEGELANVASIDETNHYVEGRERIVVPVTVGTNEKAVTGSIVVTAGYGMLEETIDVAIEPDSSPVLVDDSLGSPPPERAGGALERLPTRVLAVLLVALAGLVTAGIGGTILGGYGGLLLFVVAALGIAAGATVVLNR